MKKIVRKPVQKKLVLTWDNPWDEVFSKGVPDDLRGPYPGFAVLASKLKKGTVLDVACGAGRHAVLLAKRGFEVTGFDLSHEALELASFLFRYEKIENYKLLEADMFEEYPFAESTFDNAVAIQAIYHGYRKHMQKAIDQIHRVLKPGGVFVFTVSMDYDRSMLGARKPELKEVDIRTYIPQSGREKGLPHFYADFNDLNEMLADKFGDIEYHVDPDNSYRLVICHAVK